MFRGILYGRTPEYADGTNTQESPKIGPSRTGATGKHGNAGTETGTGTGTGMGRDAQNGSQL